jgi:hypothetical protein
MSADVLFFGFILALVDCFKFTPGCHPGLSKFAPSGDEAFPLSYPHYSPNFFEVVTQNDILYGLFGQVFFKQAEAEGLT